MDLSQNGDKLIYLRLADWVEDEILVDTFPEGSQIPSVADLSASFKINHMTTLKSIALLTDSEIIYKKRGIGMFVADGAREKILSQRKNEFYQKYVVTTVSEAQKLGIDAEDLADMIRKGYLNE